MRTLDVWEIVLATYNHVHHQNADMYSIIVFLLPDRSLLSNLQSVSGCFGTLYSNFTDIHFKDTRLGLGYHDGLLIALPTYFYFHVNNLFAMFIKCISITIDR